MQNINHKKDFHVKKNSISDQDKALITTEVFLKEFRVFWDKT